MRNCEAFIHEFFAKGFFPRTGTYPGQHLVLFCFDIFIYDLGLLQYLSRFVLTYLPVTTLYALTYTVRGVQGDRVQLLDVCGIQPPRLCNRCKRAVRRTRGALLVGYGIFKLNYVLCQMRGALNWI